MRSLPRMDEKGKVERRCQYENEGIFGNLHPAVFNNESTADDLVQETYLKAFKFLPVDKEIINAKSWLFKILMNAFINKYRKEKREPALVDFDSVEAFHQSIDAFDRLLERKVAKR